MIIKKEFEFDMAHRLPTYEGKCKNIHGHRYKLIVWVEGNVKEDKLEESDSGMVMDFGNLKNLVEMKIIDVLDHGLMVWTNDTFIDIFRDLKLAGMNVIEVDYIPTAENMVNHMASILFDFADIIKLELYETPTSSAIWEKKDE